VQGPGKITTFKVSLSDLHALSSPTLLSPPLQFDLVSSRKLMPSVLSCTRDGKP